MNQKLELGTPLLAPHNFGLEKESSRLPWRFMRL
jgi:hypothetical protein